MSETGALRPQSGSSIKMAEFKLERWFAKYEFSSKFLLCSSDCQSRSIGNLLTLKGAKEEDQIGGIEDVWLGYTETLGSTPLRKEIAKLYANEHISIEKILVHAGAQEAIHNFCKSILTGNDHVVVVSPCYQSLVECPKAAGATVSLWKLKESPDGEWSLDLEELKKELSEHPNTKVVFINSPHNPTGFVMDRQTAKSLVDLCASKNIMIFSDEVYSHLEPEGVEVSVPMCNQYENGISLNVMSKSFGLAGLRIGWVATRNSQVITAMASYKDYVSICSSAPSEYLATVALRNKEEILRDNKAIIQRNVELLESFFAKHRNHFVWKKPISGCISFPRLLRPDISMEQFCVDLVEEKGVLLLPSTMYDFGDSHFRLGFGRSNLVDALKELDDYVTKRFGSS